MNSLHSLEANILLTMPVVNFLSHNTFFSIIISECPNASGAASIVAVPMVVLTGILMALASLF